MVHIASYHASILVPRIILFAQRSFNQRSSPSSHFQGGEDKQIFFFFFLLRRKENESIGSTISLEAWRNHALVANFILFPTGFGSLSTVTPTPLSIEQKESFFTLTKSPYLDKFSNSRTKRNDSFAKRDFSVQRVRNKRGTRAHRWRAIVRLFIIKFPISPRLST